MRRVQLGGFHVWTCEALFDSWVCEGCPLGERRGGHFAVRRQGDACYTAHAQGMSPNSLLGPIGRIRELSCLALKRERSVDEAFGVRPCRVERSVL
jgi:hypothetical protein